MREFHYPRFHPVTIIRNIMRLVLIFLLIVIIFTVFYQVVLRYVFQAPPDWTEEVARFSLVWLVLLGSSACIRKSRHFNVDYVTQLMSERTIYFLTLILHLLIVAFLAVAFYYGTLVMSRSFSITSPALGVPMGYVQLIFPLGFGMMLLEAVLIVYELLRYGPDRLKEEQ
jgi:TRAP-type C4-dicarboxylate transport system permease small subunit